MNNVQKNFMYNNNNFCIIIILEIFRKIRLSDSYEKKKLFKMLISKYPKIIKIDKKNFL